MGPAPGERTDQVQVRLEYGDSHVTAELPDHARVIRAGETFTEPDALDDPVAATREALAAPLGTPPIGDLVGRGSRVVIAFPDRVKGGTHATSHRQVTIPLLMEQLTAAGVDETDVSLVCAIGLHRKNHRSEIAGYLGDELVGRFPASRLVNHDPEDPDGITVIGETPGGDVAEVNRAVAEADLAIMIGHTMGNPYGGFSGGYKMPCTGLTTWRSIRCHHTPTTMYRDDFVPASQHSHFRDQLTAIGQTIEASMSHPFFAVDATLNGRSEQLAVVAGTPTEVERASWPRAAERTSVEVDGPPAEVLVVGMPRSFHYGPGMGSNPILMMQAIGSAITRNAAALVPDPVVICTSVCDGWFNDEWFPAMREIHQLFGRCHDPAEMWRYEEELATRPEYLRAFRHGYAYHPFHGFSMLYMGGVALQRARAIYIAGARDPGMARSVGAIPTPDVAAALRQATRHVGSDPSMLVIPELSQPQVHVSATG